MTEQCKSDYGFSFNYDAGRICEKAFAPILTLVVVSIAFLYIFFRNI